MVGFFDGVRDDVAAQLPRTVTKRLVPISSRSAAKNIRLLKDHLFAAADDDIESLVILAAPRHDEWVETQMTKMISVVKRRNPNAIVESIRTLNARDASFVVEKAIGFGLIADDQEEVEAKDLESVLLGRKILCVRATNQASFLTVLQRHGFSEHSFEAHFEENVYPTDRNSNLSAKLSRRASTYAFLLYAHEGLRHLSKGPKKIWGDRLVDKRTTDSVAGAFKAKFLKN